MLWARVAGKGFGSQAAQMKRKGRLAGSWTRGVLAEAEDLADTIKSYEALQAMLCNAMVVTHHSPLPRPPWKY